MAGSEPEPGREGGRRSRARPVDLGQLFESLAPTEAAAPKTLANGLGMSFVRVPAGSFLMGSPDAEPGHRSNEGPVHEVVISQPFYLGVHPVTQWAYQAVTGRNPSKFAPASGAGGPDHPVESVSWEDATAFCRLLSDRPEERVAGRTYRLPTEAEWEYACRAGTATAFGHGLNLTPDLGNFAAPDGPAPGRTTPVTQYPASAWGLHDMHGNVWEWCADWYAEGYYREAPLRDPAGPPSGRFKVLRGGSWRNQADRCRAAYRNALAPFQRDSATGFRVVLVLTS